MPTASRMCRELALARLVVLGEQPAHRDERVTGTVDDVEDHRRRHPHVARQRLGGGLDQPGHGRLAPRHHALGHLAAHQLSALLRVVGDLRELLEVLHLVVGRLDDDGARGVVAGPPGPPGDLVELAGVEQPGAGAVVLRQRREHDGADRHVDADAEGVGAADDLEQAGLGELFDQPPVLGQHPGVVNADAVADQPRQRRSEGRREAEPADQLGDRGLLLLGADVDAHQRLRPLQRGGLGEVHDVDRRLLGVEQVVDGLVHRRGRVVVEQRDRPFGVGDQRGRRGRCDG